MSWYSHIGTVHNLDKYNLIHYSQHGFHKGFSCTTNLLTFLEEITANIDAKHSMDTVYFDLANSPGALGHIGAN